MIQILSNTFISKRLLFDNNDNQQEYEEHKIEIRGGEGPSKSMKRLILAALVMLLHEDKDRIRIRILNLTI